MKQNKNTGKALKLRPELVQLVRAAARVGARAARGELLDAACPGEAGWTSPRSPGERPPSGRLVEAEVEEEGVGAVEVLKVGVEVDAVVAGDGLLAH